MGNWGLGIYVLLSASSLRVLCVFAVRSIQILHGKEVTFRRDRALLSAMGQLMGITVAEVGIFTNLVVPLLLLI